MADRSKLIILLELIDAFKKDDYAEIKAVVVNKQGFDVIQEMMPQQYREHIQVHPNNHQRSVKLKGLSIIERWP